MRGFIFDDAGRPPHLPPDLPDCTLRAVTIATGQPYEAVASILRWRARRRFPHRRFSKAGTVPELVVREYLVALGWTAWRVSPCPLAQVRLPSTRAVVLLEFPGEPRGHVAAIVGGVVRDAWDSRAGLVVAAYLPPG